MPETESITPPTPKQIRNLLSFLPQIANPAEPFHTCDVKNSPFDPYTYSPLVDRFIQALEINGFCQPFDWPSWHNQAEAYMKDPSKLGNADIETIIKLFTIILRKERFCSGTIAAFLDNGFILTLLKRLGEIEKEISSE